MSVPHFTSNRKLDYSIFLFILVVIFYHIGYYNSTKRTNKLRGKANESEKRFQQENQLFNHEMQLDMHENTLNQLRKKLKTLEKSAISHS